MVPRGLASNYCERVHTRIYTVYTGSHKEQNKHLYIVQRQRNKQDYISLNFQDSPFPEVAVKTDPVEAEE